MQRKPLRKDESRLRIGSKIGEAQGLESTETTHSLYEGISILAAIEPVFKLRQISPQGTRMAVRNGPSNLLKMLLKIDIKRYKC